MKKEYFFVNYKSDMNYKSETIYTKLYS